jgi:ATP-dependent RNA helicase DDX19/DBP5
MSEKMGEKNDSKKVSWADISDEPGADQKSVSKPSPEESGDGLESVYRSEVTFESLGLKPQVYQNVLCELKYVTPSKIQAESLPIVLSDKRPNFIGQSKAGSGKTAAYALAIMNRIDPSLKYPQAIILVPVRELAIQVYDQVLVKLAKNTGITVKKAIPDEAKGLVTDQIVVGTPGTVLAKLRSKEIDGSRITMFVCDEADRMITQHGGLGDQTLRIKRECTNKQLQVLLFSATFPPTVNKFAEVIAPNASSIRIKKEEVSLANVKQFWVATKPGDAKEKYGKLVMLNGLMNMGQSLIFVETVKTAKELTNQLRTDGYSVSVLYGKDLKPTERDAVMRDFVTGKTTVLIATNVASRGIDVPSVNFVVNYELPVMHAFHSNQSKADFETYCHRVGRAGRFGRIGAAINFASNNEEKQIIAQIQKFFNKPITELSFDNFEHLENTIKHHLAPPSTATPCLSSH